MEVQLADSLVVPMIQALFFSWPLVDPLHGWIFKSRNSACDLGVSVESCWIGSLTFIIFGCGCAQLLGMSEILRDLFTVDMSIGLMTNTSDLKAKDGYCAFACTQSSSKCLILCLGTQ